MTYPPRLRCEFDARWDEHQRQSAIIGADHQAIQAKADLDEAIREVERATKAYIEALAWTSQIRALVSTPSHGTAGREQR